MSEGGWLGLVERKVESVCRSFWESLRVFKVCGGVFSGVVGGVWVINSLQGLKHLRKVVLSLSVFDTATVGDGLRRGLGPRVHHHSGGVVSYRSRLIYVSDILEKLLGGMYSLSKSGEYRGDCWARALGEESKR